MDARTKDTEVLIIGAGPTGLMMACQLLRYGVKFRILDKQKDRAHESRAFAIQAKSMEIFQNLGCADEFLKVAHSNVNFAFFINGKKQIEIKFKHFKHQDTPFPSVYFLPQTETERIFIEFLEKQGVYIERQKELITFSQNMQGVQANIKDLTTGITEKLACDYIIGCDGAHSIIRHTLNFSFEGNAYPQIFNLVDASIVWPYSRNKFLFFLGKDGVFVHIPLTEKISRIMLAKRLTRSNAKLSNPNLIDLEHLASLLTQVPVKLVNPIWISQFHLHHRGVTKYYKNRAFLVGDAAHIHSPVGGQGMNTGIQDATNLAWKIALVVKKDASIKLLDSYETERHPVGKILLKTTDQFFSLLTAKGFFISKLRNWILPFVISFLFSKKNIEKRLFWFMSQLNIHYAKNQFNYEIIEKSYQELIGGPCPGYRAPNAPANSSSLFILLAQKPFNILSFKTKEEQPDELIEKVNTLIKKYKAWLQVHAFVLSPTNKLLFKRYGVIASAIYVIRPDGYVGFRVNSDNYLLLEEYLKNFFK
jgi:2-polyprenyl-6-methoxyphenol hydroxylase-like FAD-dependent oxidoreductase